MSHESHDPRRHREQPILGDVGLGLILSIAQSTRSISVDCVIDMLWYAVQGADAACDLGRTGGGCVAKPAGRFFWPSRGLAAA